MHIGGNIPCGQTMQASRMGAKSGCGCGCHRERASLLSRCPNGRGCPRVAHLGLVTTTGRSLQQPITKLPPLLLAIYTTKLSDLLEKYIFTQQSYQIC